MTFNNAEEEAVGSSTRVCSSYVTVDYEGTVTMNNISYDVLWSVEGPLARGNHTMLVHSRLVCDAQPTSSDAHNRLSITFVAPVSHGSVCDVDEAFSNGVSYTSFEVDGRFLQKSGVLSQACWREQFFPKPTCFHEVRCRRSARAKQACLGVEVLLDHLFRRNNLPLPVHVTKRLIPRFVTSNPSPSYIRSMEDAFRSGAYDGKTNSGSYGDLGATIAAILLHTEARSSGVFLPSLK